MCCKQCRPLATCCCQPMGSFCSHRRRSYDTVMADDTSSTAPASPRTPEPGSWSNTSSTAPTRGSWSNLAFAPQASAPASGARPGALAHAMAEDLGAKAARTTTDFLDLVDELEADLVRTPAPASRLPVHPDERGAPAPRTPLGPPPSVLLTYQWRGKGLCFVCLLPRLLMCCACLLRLIIASFACCFV